MASIGLRPGQRRSVYARTGDPAMTTGSVLSAVPFYATKKKFLPPMLTSEGARVDPDWLMRFLKDPSLMQSGEKPSTPTSTAAAPKSSPNAPAAKPAASNANDQSNGKLQPQWGANRNGIRPYIQVHMPTFNFSPNELRMLV